MTKAKKRAIYRVREEKNSRYMVSDSLPALPVSLKGNSKATERTTGTVGLGRASEAAGKASEKWG